MKAEQFELEIKTVRTRLRNLQKQKMTDEIRMALSLAEHQLTFALTETQRVRGSVPRGTLDRADG